MYTGHQLASNVFMCAIVVAQLHLIALIFMFVNSL